MRASLQAALLVVLTLSSWAAIDGVVFGDARLGACRDPHYEFLCFYVPEFSALWRPFVEWTQPSVQRAAVGVYFGVVYAWLAAPIVSALTCHASGSIVAVRD